MVETVNRHNNHYEEVASVIDEAAEQAADIAADIEDIAAAKEEQMDRADEIRQRIDQQSF